MPDFSSWSLIANLGVFAAAAVFVWLAGTRISWYADEISERTGLSQALLGLLLLAGVTSLPEISTSFTAAQAGDALLAVNNLLGSIAMQVALIAVADLVIGRHALTAVVPNPGLLLQGALNIVLLAFVAIAALVGDAPVFGVGAWSSGLLVAAAYSFWKITDSDRQKRAWIPNSEKAVPADGPAEGGQNEDVDEDTRRGRPKIEDGWPVLIGKLVAAGLVILVAGFIVARTGGAIAEKSGLGSSFVGMALVAVATSLPEASAVFAAARMRRYTMAISEILGTNVLNVALLFGVDAVAPGEPVLTQAGRFAAVGAMLGAAVTGLLVMGLAERRDRSLFRMGEDSIAILLVYGGGLALLFTLR